MRVFKDRKSGELFAKPNEYSMYLFSLYDNHISAETNLDLEEIETKKVENTYRFDRITEESFSAKNLVEHDFRLKEILYIPVDDKEIPFRVEHVTDEKAYLVSVDAIGRTTMTDMNDFLDNFMKKLPEDLLNIMGEIEHKFNGYIIRKSKVTLVSYGNLSGVEFCNGADDLLFDGMQTETERCKNFEGISCWWWIDSPYIADPKSFIFVSETGAIDRHRGDNVALTVCPCIAIRRNKEVK